MNPFEQHPPIPSYSEHLSLIQEDLFDFTPAQLDPNQDMQQEETMQALAMRAIPTSSAPAVNTVQPKVSLYSPAQLEQIRFQNVCDRAANQCEETHAQCMEVVNELFDFFQALEAAKNVPLVAQRGEKERSEQFLSKYFAEFRELVRMLPSPDEVDHSSPKALETLAQITYTLQYKLTQLSQFKAKIGTFDPNLMMSGLLVRARLGLQRSHQHLLRNDQTLRTLHREAYRIDQAISKELAHNDFSQKRRLRSFKEKFKSRHAECVTNLKQLMTVNAQWTTFANSLLRKQCYNFEMEHALHSQDTALSQLRERVVQLDELLMELEEARANASKRRKRSDESEGALVHPALDLPEVEVRSKRSKKADAPQTRAQLHPMPEVPSTNQYWEMYEQQRQRLWEAVQADATARTKLMMHFTGAAIDHNSQETNEARLASVQRSMETLKQLSASVAQTVPGVEQTCTLPEVCKVRREETIEKFNREWKALTTDFRATQQMIPNAVLVAHRTHSGQQYHPQHQLNANLQNVFQSQIIPLQQAIKQLKADTGKIEQWTPELDLSCIQKIDLLRDRVVEARNHVASIFHSAVYHTSVGQNPIAGHWKNYQESRYRQDTPFIKTVPCEVTDT